MPYADPQTQKEYWRARGRTPEHKERKRAKLLARSPEQIAATADYNRKYRLENTARINVAKRRWERAHCTEIRERKRPWAQEYSKRYARAHKERLRPYKAAWCAARRARILKATPGWANTRVIEDSYKRASEQNMHVDHVVPLTSKLVCGLHCEANLRLLEGLENQRKSNKHWPDMP